MYICYIQHVHAFVCERYRSHIQLNIACLHLSRSPTLSLLAFSAARLGASFSRLLFRILLLLLFAFLFCTLFVLVTIQIDCSLKLMKCLRIYCICSFISYIFFFLSSLLPHLTTLCKVSFLWILRTAWISKISCLGNILFLIDIETCSLI